MRAGKLNKFVRIENPTNVSDSQLGFTTTWALAEEVWAAVEPLTAREYFQAGVVDPRITHRVRMRHTANMKHDSRIVLGARTFHPLQPPVNVDESGAELTMNCEERLA